MQVYSRCNGFSIGEFDISPGANLSGARLYGANLRGVNLSGANLSGSDLRGAYFYSANLSGADLRGANLSGVDLSHANLSGVDLSHANLSGSDLRGAYFYSAYLSGADLSGADLSGTNLSDADFYNANLSRSDLRDANLSGVNLSGANLEDAKLPKFQIPQDEELIVFKKLRDRKIAKLRIPTGAKRTASLRGNKCRAERAIVLEIYYASDSEDKFQTGKSVHDPSFIYEVGKEVKPANRYNGDIRLECRPGIHFFMTEEEARRYDFR